MGAKENLELIERWLEATEQRDIATLEKLLAEDATFRMAGVPRAMGGVTEGRDKFLDNFRQGTANATFKAKTMFGDDTNVCVVGKFSSDSFPGNEFLKAADKPFSTYECVVYRIASGRIAESTAYVNWLDPYVQTGIVDPASFTT